MGVTRAFAPMRKTVPSFLLVESNDRDSCTTSRDTRYAHNIPQGVVYPIGPSA